MKCISLPESDLQVSALAYGTGGLGSDMRGADADRMVAACLEAGINFFDTAHCYAFWTPEGAGCSERELGAALRRLGALDLAVIATKGGHSDGGPDYPRPAVCLAPELIAQDLEESLERLGVERIDLYYLHRDDGVTPLHQLLELLNREIERGRVRYLGASNWSVQRIKEANALAAAQGMQGFVASQDQWSLAEPTWPVEATDPTMRYVRTEELAWHTESQMPVVAYSATAGGYFAGRGQAEGNYVTPENAARYQRAQEIAHALGTTPTQVALAWLMRHPFPVIPLFSTHSLAHLAEVAQAADLTLTPEQVHFLA